VSEINKSKVSEEFSISNDAFGRPAQFTLETAFYSCFVLGKDWKVERYGDFI
jgi:hypothetical protein